MFPAQNVNMKNSSMRTLYYSQSRAERTRTNGNAAKLLHYSGFLSDVDICIIYKPWSMS